MTAPETSLDRIHDSLYDQSAAKYEGDPYARIGRDDIVIFFCDADDGCVVSIDMFRKATDQLSTVGIEIGVSASHAKRFEQLLRSVRSVTEVASEWVTGNLNIAESLAIGNLPRRAHHHDTEVEQHIRIFRKGHVIPISSGI